MSRTSSEKEKARREFEALVEASGENLNLGGLAFAICAEEYPGVSVAQGLARLDALAQQAAPRVRAAANPLARLGALTGFLYEDYGLRGNREDYYDARNSYLSDVVERRLGIPISLAVLCIEVGRRVGVGLRGVGFPAHFLMKPDGISGLFVDPFDGGRLLDENGCRALLEELTGGQIPFDRRHLRPVSKREILVRMLRNLKRVYLEREDLARSVACCDRILLLDPSQSQEYRDRGVLRLQAGEYNLAHTDLERYLSEEPAAPDRLFVASQAAKAQKKHWSVN